MKSKRLMWKGIALILLCAVLGSALPRALAESATFASAELGIYVFGATSAFDSDRGHAFLALKNTGSSTINFLNYPVKPGEEITLGYWDSYKLSINRDAVEDIRNKNGSHAEVSMRKDLNSDEEIRKLIEHTVDYSGTAYDDLTHNCTTYAVEAWNLVNDEKPIRNTSILNSLMDTDTSDWTWQYFEEHYGEEGLTAELYFPDPALTEADVFYIQPDATLIPAHPKLRNFDAEVDLANAPLDIYVFWNKRGRELCDGSILTNYVVVEYSKKYEEGSQPVETWFEAVPQGCVLPELEQATTYLVRARPLYVFMDAVSKQVAYTQGDWTYPIEVTTGGTPLPDIKFVYEHGTEIGTVIATDPDTGGLIWTYSTPGGVPFQLEHSAEIGLFGTHYYFEYETDMICLDAYTGEVLWKLDDQIDWGPISAFDEDGNIYMAFYLSDLIMQVSPDGEILHTLHADDFGDQVSHYSIFWADELEVMDGYLAIRFTGDTYEGYGADEWTRIDLDTWTLIQD